MDSITAAIVAALAAGVIGGVTDVGKSAIVDAYQGLKSLLKSKFGGESKVVKAVDDLEGTPDSKGRQETLQEEVAKAHADQYLDILEAANKMSALLQSQGIPTGKYSNVQVRDSQGVVIGEQNQVNIRDINKGG